MRPIAATLGDDNGGRHRNRLLKHGQWGRAIHRLTGAFEEYRRCEAGASSSEYALMLLVLGGCGIVIMHHLGHRMNAVFIRVATAMTAH